MPFLIDGYNLYHSARKLLPAGPTIAPRTMCRLIAQDMHRLRDHAVIVFDGTEPRGQFERIEPPVYVRLLYSGPNREADCLIEQLIKENTAPAD